MIDKLTIRILFFLLLFSGLTKAQVSDKSTVFINTSSVTQIPADNIFFSIALSVENGDAEKAYNEHKALESSLLKVLREFDIPDSNISYSLLQIGKNPSFSKEQTSYKTRQLVSVLLEDFSKYDSLQLALLSKDIYQYTANFTSTGDDEWIERGTQEALVKATKEAEMTAKSIGMKLGKILEVESSHYSPFAKSNVSALTVLPPGDSLIELPRFVQLRVSLRVRFELKEE